MESLYIQIPAKIFKHHVEFIKGSEESYAMIKYENNKLLFSNVEKCGIIGKDISLDVQAFDAIVDQSFEQIFSHKSLQCVNTAHELHMMLTISYPNGDQGPVLYTFLLDDRSEPYSYYNLYIMQKVVSD